MDNPMDKSMDTFLDQIKEIIYDHSWYSKTQFWMVATR